MTQESGRWCGRSRMEVGASSARFCARANTMLRLPSTRCACPLVGGQDMGNTKSLTYGKAGAYVLLLVLCAVMLVAIFLKRTSVRFETPSRASPALWTWNVRWVTGDRGNSFCVHLYSNESVFGRVAHIRVGPATATLTDRTEVPGQAEIIQLARQNRLVRVFVEADIETVEAVTITTDCECEGSGPMRSDAYSANWDTKISGTELLRVCGEWRKSGSAPNLRKIDHDSN